MGARPLRRAIQRFIEDPLADEVLKAGELPPGATVMVEKDAKGDEERPLKLKIVKPRKKPAPKKKEPEKVGVGAKGSDDSDEGGDGEPESEGDSKD
jgi:ATP-dependent Clp protease ATP-binding subunit ClpC